MGAPRVPGIATGADGAESSGGAGAIVSYDYAGIGN